MFKFIIPAVIVFLIVLFWEKITEVVFKKFNIKISYVMIVVFIVILGAILTLLYY